MPQPFLETGKCRLFVAGLDIDHAIRGEPCCGETGGKQILVAHAPQDLAHSPRHDARGEEGGGGAVQCAVAGTGNLVQRTESQATTR